MAATDTFEMTTGGGTEPTAAVIWMHGLGADAHDFEPIVPLLDLGPERAIRFIFPNAPVRPVTLNGGLPMRAWYDLLSLERNGPEDEAGIRASGALVAELINREVERGIDSARVVVAGFSQGGAVALYTALRYPVTIAGVLALSTYLPLADIVKQEAHAANAGVRIFMAHGEDDEVVAINFARNSRKRLHDMGYDVDWRVYPMAHSIVPQEVVDIKSFLSEIL